MAQEIFISHSSEDKATADAVCGALEGAGLSCWIAPRDVRPGKFFPGEIKRAIERCRVMVLIFSAHSNSSSHVLREIDFATRAHAHIVNFRIEKVAVSDDLDYFLALPHWLDALTPPTKECLTQLVTSVCGLLELPPKAPLLPPNPNDTNAPAPSPSARPASTSAAPAVPAVFVAPEPKTAPSAVARADQRKARRNIAREFAGEALREAEVGGGRPFDDSMLLEPLIRVLARAGDNEGAIRAAAANGGGFKDFALSIIAETQARDGDVTGARATVESCEEKGDAYCRMARGMADSGDVAGALRTVGEIGKQIFQGFDPRASALSEIAEAQAKMGDVVGALKTVGAIELSSPNRMQQKEARRYRESTLAHIAEAQAQAGDIEGATRTFNVIEDAKVRGRARNKIIAARARGGDPAGALEEAKENTSDKKGWVLGCIAEAQAQAGDFAAAASTVTLLEEDYRRDQAISAIAVAHARAGDHGKARSVNDSIGNPYVRRKSHARLMLAFAETGDTKPALDVMSTQPLPRDRIKMNLAFAAFLLDDPNETRWWMDFSTHHLWD